MSYFLLSNLVWSSGSRAILSTSW